MNRCLSTNLSVMAKCGTESNLTPSQSQKQSKHKLVAMPPYTLLHIASFLEKDEILNLKEMPNSIFKTSLKIRNIENVIVPKTDIYRTEQIEKVKQMHGDVLYMLFRMHPLEEIRDTILCLCSEPLSDHAPTYLAQAHAYYLAEIRLSIYRYSIFSQELNDAFISVANHTDHNSTGRQYLAQAFANLINTSNGLSFFIKDESFQNSFISLVNQHGHNSTGRQSLAQAFVLLTLGSDAITFFCESESFQNSCISLVKQNGHTPAGLKYLSYVGHFLINNSSGIPFWVIESFLNALDTAHIVHRTEPLKNNSNGVSFWEEGTQSFLNT